MTEKKLFPGVSQQDIEKQEALKLAEQKRLEEQERIKQQQLEEEKRRKQEQERISKLYDKYTTVKHTPFSQTVNDLAKVSTVIAAIVFLLGNICYQFWGADEFELDAQNNVRSNPLYTPYKQALHDAYWPITDGKFTPTVGWAANMLIAIFVATSAAKFVKDRRNNNLILEKQKTAINLMDEIQKSTKIKLSDQQISALQAVSQNIIKNMSADSRVYFDMILNGDISADNEKDILQLATTIMEGHLKSHPEDFKKVLAVFDTRSIPQHLIEQYKSHTK